MRLYSGSTKQFVADTQLNQITDKLRLSFFEQLGFNPSDSEIRSWRNSLRAMAGVVDYAGLMDHGLLLEYQIPLTSLRLDCLVTGINNVGNPNAVIVELKQWELCGRTDGENEVLTYLGGRAREVLHPAVQVGRYHQYLQDVHTAFYEGDDSVMLGSCSYLHNYSYQEKDPLKDDKFSKAREHSPVFTADEVQLLSGYLGDRLRGGNGLSVLQKVEQSKYRPSKKLMDHVGNVIKGKPEYVLLDEQLVVYDRVFTAIKLGFHEKGKQVIIVRGGPGTGKSVVAINLMSDLLLNGYNAQYATGSKAFTQTLRNVIGSRGASQFKYFNSYKEAETNMVDVLICDEAHRIREYSYSRFTKKADRYNTPQIEELIRASKVSVFFIDDYQVVRPFEIGSSDYIGSHAKQKSIQVHDYELEVQFRCSGSEAFVNWINHTLGIKRTANPIWMGDERFDFRIVESPQVLENMIREKAEIGFSARITAGFCWPWSKPKKDGTLVEDVDLGDYKKPWNARGDAGRLAPNIPKEVLWAYDPNGIKQIGCVYTAQGFEFDYIGVIFGKDLVFRFEQNGWIGQKENSEDSVVKQSGEKFIELVKNTYRVLLTRGLQGCYVYFVDKETEKFFRARIEHRPIISFT